MLSIKSFMEVFRTNSLSEFKTILVRGLVNCSQRDLLSQHRACYKRDANQISKKLEVNFEACIQALLTEFMSNCSSAVCKQSSIEILSTNPTARTLHKFLIPFDVKFQQINYGIFIRRKESNRRFYSVYLLLKPFSYFVWLLSLISLCSVISSFKHSCKLKDSHFYIISVLLEKGNDGRRFLTRNT